MFKHSTTLTPVRHAPAPVRALASLTTRVRNDIVPYARICSFWAPLVGLLLPLSVGIDGVNAFEALMGLQLALGGGYLALNRFAAVPDTPDLGWCNGSMSTYLEAAESLRANYPHIEGIDTMLADVRSCASEIAALTRRQARFHEARARIIKHDRYQVSSTTDRWAHPGSDPVLLRLQRESAALVKAAQELFSVASIRLEQMRGLARALDAATGDATPAELVGIISRADALSSRVREAAETDRVRREAIELIHREAEEFLAARLAELENTTRPALAG